MRRRSSWFREEFDTARKLVDAGLDVATEAFRWFDDVRTDYPDEVEVEDAGGAKLGVLAAAAHQAAHDLGDLLGGAYGCDMKYEEGAWLRTCRLSLMHNRIGQSPGFSVRYVCSICGGDPLRCSHELNKTYSVPMFRIDDRCNVCGEGSCGHVVGEVYAAVAGVVWTDPVIHEISVVPRPRDPRAVFLEVEVPADELEANLARMPDAYDSIVCHDCIGTCLGFGGPRKVIGQRAVFPLRETGVH